MILHKVTPIENGDIVVYEIEGEGIPIVHRVITVQIDGDGKRKYLTKGDNNPVDDRGLYNKGVLYLTDSMVVGKVAGIIPYGGYLTIMLNDYPLFKYAVLGLMLITVLVQKDPNA